MTSRAYGTFTPRPVRLAGAIAALEGLLAIVTAVVLGVREAGGHHEVGISGYGTAGWVAIMGSGVAAAGWALWTGRRWGRGAAGSPSPPARMCRPRCGRSPTLSAFRASPASSS